ncbi:hypothetical protein [Streptomyces achromogenes]|uniref:hypothetical protein n=1 Tax=Streptomyces achromogenes TaxID=67255 RepID=UPI003695ED82
MERIEVIALRVRSEVMPSMRARAWAARLSPRSVWVRAWTFMDVIRTGLVTPVWCTSWRQDATTLIGPLLDIPPLPHVDLPRPRITTSHPNGYLWKRDHVDGWLGDAPAVWIDDDFTDLDHSWAAERTTSGVPTLLVQPDPHVGLRAEHLAATRAWASRLRDTRTAAPAAPVETEAA